MKNMIEDRDRAERFAKAVVSDIIAYNEKLVLEGMKNDDLFIRLKAEIEEAREQYLKRVSEEIDKKYNIFNRALVDVLLFSQRSVKSPAW